MRDGPHHVVLVRQVASPKRQMQRRSLNIERHERVRQAICTLHRERIAAEVDVVTPRIVHVGVDPAKATIEGQIGREGPSMLRRQPEWRVEAHANHVGLQFRVPRIDDGVTALKLQSTELRVCLEFRTVDPRFPDVLVDECRSKGRHFDALDQLDVVDLRTIDS